MSLEYHAFWLNRDNFHKLEQDYREQWDAFLWDCAGESWEEMTCRGYVPKANFHSTFIKETKLKMSNM